MAKILIGLGVLFLIIGLIWHFFPTAFNWFGRMPGDVNYRSEGGGFSFSFHFPIVTMIIVSIVLSILLNIFKR